ncbi:MAG: nucleoside deaminase [Kiritimatiellae bacterium]|nr:nucleoside deaminase [Kiritimatiellia bacterium]
MFLSQAIELARRKSRDGKHGPFGALVVRDGAIVGSGCNRVVDLKDPTAHAEVMAIRDACARLGTPVLSGCTIYCSCEPCPMCLAAILWARIGKVVFACTREDAARAGLDDVKILEEVRRDWDTRTIAWEQRERDAGLAVFEAWLENPDRVPY